MPRGDKSSYTTEQKRQARHVEKSCESREVSKNESERRAWATVNAETHGGTKSGSGRGLSENHALSRKASHPAGARSRSAKNAAATRGRRGR